MVKVNRTVVSKPKPKPKPNVTTRKRSFVKQSGLLELPVKKKGPITDIGEYSILLYGPPKIGKTSCFASFPDAIFAPFEPGTKGLEIFQFGSLDGGMKDWKEFARLADLLERDERFRNVIVDTGQGAYDYCRDSVCSDRGIEYPGVDAKGTQDHGRSWAAVEQEFKKQISRIIRTGRGLHFTAHSTTTLVKSRSGIEYNRIEPRFTGQAGRTILPLVDFIFMIDYFKIGGNQTSRVLITLGDDLLVAGQRSTGLGISLPRYILLPDDAPEQDYEVLATAFRGECRGIDVEQLQPTFATSAGATAAVEKHKNKAAARRVKGGTQ